MNVGLSPETVYLAGCCQPPETDGALRRCSSTRAASTASRILGRKSVELMTTNHIGDREVDIVVGPGYGFGFGYAVRKTIAGSFLPGSPGTFGWGGAAGTWFFVDPQRPVRSLLHPRLRLSVFPACRSLLSLREDDL